jgi:hypothetical protein
MLLASLGHSGASLRDRTARCLTRLAATRLLDDLAIVILILETVGYSSPSLGFLLTTHYSLLTASPHFSTHFHSRSKPINPHSTPSNLSTSV